MAYRLFTLPDACRYGHPWGPGAVNISWVACGCAGGRGHHRVRCMTDGCPSVWYSPAHEPGGDYPPPAREAPRQP
jgi:hypothetical protein